MENDVIALIAILIIVVLGASAFYAGFHFFPGDGNRATKRPSHQYEFNLNMDDNNDYYAFIWNLTSNKIVASKVFNDEQEALDFLQERASFLQIEEYEVIRKIG